MGLSNGTESGADSGEDCALKTDVESGVAASVVGSTAEEQEADEQVSSPLVLVLCGRVGVGKSSSANAIVRAAPPGPFAARRSAAAVTLTCLAETAEVMDREILVLDTPGLGDASTSDSAVHEEILRGFAELVPKGAPACLVLVFSLNGRVGEDELATVTSLEQRVFGRSMLDTAVVLWTHADLLDEGASVEQYLEGADPRVRKFLANAKGGSVAWDNRRPRSDPGASSQLEDLLARADRVARPIVPNPLEVRTFGRRTARRRRQMESGLLRAPKKSGGCAIA